VSLPKSTNYSARSLSSSVLYTVEIASVSQTVLLIVENVSFELKSIDLVSHDDESLLSILLLMLRTE